ncbi:MAG: DUF4358 domain-containing protein [Oscillospiraceae bacterium]
MKIKSILAFSLALVLSVSAMAGCTKKTAGDGESSTPPSSETPKKAATGMLKTVHEDVKKIFGEEYIPSQAFDETYLQEQFGITKDMVKEVIAEGPMMSMHVDTFVGIEAAEGKVDEVEKKLNDYRQKLIDESMQYPMNMPKIKASAVTKVDDYVFFTILGKYADDIEEENAQLKHFEAETKKVKDAINSALKK